MATSGSYDYGVTLGDMIRRAFRLCDVAMPGEALSAEEEANGREAAEHLVKALQAQGIHLWAFSDATLFLESGKRSYELGPDGDHATESYTGTALAADAVASDTAVDVDSDTGISDGDNIGIVLDDDTFHWTTVNGAPSGDTITLTDAIPSAAATDNAVYAYTNKVQKPLRIHTVRIEVDGQETPILQYSRQEYFDQPNKDIEGRVTQFYYQPQIDKTLFYVWPTSDTVNDLIHFTFEQPLQDFDNSTNEPYLPIEWADAFTLKLAHRLALEYSVPARKRAELKAESEQALAEVEDWDREDADVQLQPDFRF